MLPAMPKHITLIGMMGAGKSSVAPLVAAPLGRRVIEVDRLIEEQEGVTIAEIFKVRGEPSFRDLESAAITRLLSEPPAVLSLGGGAFLWESTRELLLARTAVFYLSASLDALVARLGSGEVAVRPLLNSSGKEVRETLRELLIHRDVKYALAHHHIDTDHASPGEVAQAILALREHYV